VVDDRHQLHELRVDPYQLGMQRRDVFLQLEALLDDLRPGVRLAGGGEHRRPSLATVCACSRVGAVTISDSTVWVASSLAEKPIPALARRRALVSARSRTPRWSANFCGPDSTRLAVGAVVDVELLFFFDVDFCFGAGWLTCSVTMLR